MSSTNHNCATFQAKLDAIRKDVEVIDLLILYTSSLALAPGAGQKYYADAVDAIERIKEQLKK